MSRCKNYRCQGSQVLCPLLVLFAGLFSCSQDDGVPAALLLPPNTLTVEDIEGTVAFWEFDDVNKYYIDVAVPGTIDSSVAGLVDEMPEEFQVEGMRVLFSGTYSQSPDNPAPFLGGQQVYSLELSSIQSQ